jgi:hypothetical protein
MGKGGGDCSRPALLLPDIDGVDLTGGGEPLRGSSTTDALGGARHDLSPEEHAELIQDVFDYFDKQLRKPLDFRVGETDPYLSELSIARLALQINVYQSLTQHKLDKRAFEEAMVVAYEAAGFEAVRPAAFNNPGHDLEVAGGHRLSLKTETIQHADLVRISKLMEARGINKIRTKAQAMDVVENVREHLTRYDQILTLRSAERTHDDGSTDARYELLEIPKDVLGALSDVTEKDFRRPRSGSGTTSARVNFNGQWAFTLQLDGSVEKVEIRNLRRDLCRELATFRADLTTPDA